MSLDRRERDYNSDDRRVSFSLPQNRKNRETFKEETSKDSQESLGDSSVTESVQSVNYPPSIIKQKKKWKIKLPWKKQKKERIQSPRYVEETINEETSDIEELKPEEKSIPGSDSDVEQESHSVKETHSVLKDPRNKYFSWYGDSNMKNAFDDGSRDNISSTMSQSVSVDVLEQYYSDTLLSDDNLSNNKKSYTDKKHSKYSERSFSLGSSSEDEKEDISKRKGTKGKKSKAKTLERSSMRNVSKSQPDLIESKEIAQEIEKLKMGQRFSNSEYIENLNFIEIDKPEIHNDANNKTPIKKSNSLPHIFFKKKKKKKIETLTKKSVHNKKLSEGNLEPMEINEHAHEKNPTCHAMNDSTEDVLSQHSIEPLSPKPGPSRVISQSPPILPNPKRSKKSRTKTNSQEGNFNASEKENKSPDVDRVKKTSKSDNDKKHTVKSVSPKLSKFKDFDKFSKSSSLNKDFTTKSVDNFLNPKNFNNTFPKTSDLRVRRRSYEEMINLLEEEMFQSYSEDESTDTDLDQVDLSFKKKIEKNSVEPIQNESGFKLRNVYDCDSLSNKTELVFESMTIPKKYDSDLSSQNTDNKKSPTLRRPSGAPPPPPKSLLPTINNENLIFSKQPNREEEKTKKKKYRKTKKTRYNIGSSNSNSSSLEDLKEALYANVPSKTGFNGQSNLKKMQTLSEGDPNIGKTLKLNSYDSDSPPTFSPPPIPEFRPLDIKTDNITPETTYALKENSDNIINKSTTINSANIIAKSLFIKRDERINSSIDSEDKYLTNLPIKDIKSTAAYKSKIVYPPPPPPLLPPSLEDPFITSKRIPNVESYTVKNLPPKLEYSSYKPSYQVEEVDKNPRSNLYSSFYLDGDKKESISKDVGSKSTLLSEDSLHSKYEPKTMGHDKQIDMKSLYSSNKNETLSAYNDKKYEMKSIKKEERHEPNSVRPRTEDAIVEIIPLKPARKEENNNPYTFQVKNKEQEAFHSSHTLPSRNDPLKKQIVTFHLPPKTNKDDDQTSSSDLKITYHDLTHGHKTYYDSHFEKENKTEHNNTFPKTEHQSHLNVSRLQEKPTASPMLQRTVLSMKQDALQVAYTKQSVGNYELSSVYHREDFDILEPPSRHNDQQEQQQKQQHERQKQEQLLQWQQQQQLLQKQQQQLQKQQEEQKFQQQELQKQQEEQNKQQQLQQQKYQQQQLQQQRYQQQYQQQQLQQQQQQQDRHPQHLGKYSVRPSQGFIAASSPIPYKKRDSPLKSILRNSTRSMSWEHSQEETQPNLVQTNITYINPLNTEVSNLNRQLVVNKQIHPNTVAIPSVCSTDVERVEIIDDSSNSDSESIPPLPKYPPPPSRPISIHQQQFLGGLLQAESNNATWRPLQNNNNMSPLDPMNYIPTIIEVSGRTSEPESVYQNVIHASQV